MGVITVKKTATHLLKANAGTEDFEFITPCEGQCAYVVSHFMQMGALRNDLYHNVEAVSVEAFWEPIQKHTIMSFVRLNKHTDTAFQSYSRHLNVAHTRSPLGNIIIVYPNALAPQQLWPFLLLNYRDKGLQVNGRFTNKKTCVALIPLKTRRLMFRNPSSKTHAFIHPSDIIYFLTQTSQFKIDLFTKFFRQLFNKHFEVQHQTLFKNFLTTFNTHIAIQIKTFAKLFTHILKAYFAIQYQALYRNFSHNSSNAHFAVQYQNVYKTYRKTFILYSEMTGARLGYTGL